MFYQVKVPVTDRDCLRFYWWKNGDIETTPIEYRMTVHLFILLLVIHLVILNPLLLHTLDML
jgi:hypothetical protein